MQKKKITIWIYNSITKTTNILYKKRWQFLFFSPLTRKQQPKHELLCRDWITIYILLTLIKCKKKTARYTLQSLLRKVFFYNIYSLFHCLNESNFNIFKNFTNCSYKLLKEHHFRQHNTINLSCLSTLVERWDYFFILFRE